MNCLSPLRRFQQIESWWHALFLCFGTFFGAAIYLAYAWTILGSMGLLRWLNSMSLPLRGSTMNECSTLLEGPCLVDASVAHFVQDHVRYAQDIVDLFFDCGPPVTAHWDAHVLRRDACGVQVLEGVYAKGRMVQPPEDLVTETGPVVTEFSWGLHELDAYLGAMGDILASAFALGLSSLPIKVSTGLNKLREAELQDAIVMDPSAPYLIRVRAALQKEDILMSIAPELVQAGTDTFVESLTPFVEKYTRSIAAALRLGHESLRVLEDDVSRVRKLVASISFFRFWRIYKFIFGDTSRTNLLAELMEHLISADKHVRHVVPLLEDMHENFLLMVRYLHWYRDNSDGLLASYRPDGLKSFGEEINDAAQNYAQLLDDCNTLRYLVGEHPADLVSSPVVNKRKNQMTIEP